MVQIPGLLLVADDNHYNMEAMKVNLASIDRIDNAQFFYDGKTVVEYVEQVFEFLPKSDK
jgi:hypothetical protein